MHVPDLPEPGQIVRVRSRQFLVEEVAPRVEARDTRVRMSCVDDDAQGEELHDAMDRAVLDAYGWTDLRPTCEFLLDWEEPEDEDSEDGGRKSRRKKPWRYRWPDEVRDEVLARLLALNQQRAEEERKLAPPKDKKAKGKRKPKASPARPRSPKSAPPAVSLPFSGEGGPIVTEEEFVAGLVARWTRSQERAAPAPVDPEARAWILGLAELGRRLLDDAADPPALRRFRSVVMADREAFEARVRDRIGEQLQRLGPAARHWLDLLNTEPDLLGPFDFVRAETVHTRLLGWALRGHERPRGIGGAPLRELLKLLSAHGCPFAADALGHPADKVRVFAERAVPPFGRTDLWLTFQDLGDLVVEVKVDHVEREDQLSDYRKALVRYGCSAGHGDVVFLTVRGDEPSDRAAVSLTFDDLLRAWIPLCEGPSGEHAYFRTYLKSVADLCGLGGEGRFEDWHWSRQALTLDFVEEA